MFRVYVLEKPDGRFYVGHSDDLTRRLSEHNSPEKVCIKLGTESACRESCCVAWLERLM